MNKLITLIILIIIPGVSIAQNKYSNSIYLCFQPADFGIGMRIDYHIINTELYNSLSYGNWGDYRKAGILNHTKLTMGAILFSSEHNRNTYSITTGINYHLFGKQERYIHRISDPWSFELGVSLKMKRLSFGMRTDVLRWEPCVDVGYRIKMERKRFRCK